MVLRQVCKEKASWPGCSASFSQAGKGTKTNTRTIKMYEMEPRGEWAPVLFKNKAWQPIVNPITSVEPWVPFAAWSTVRGYRGAFCKFMLEQRQATWDDLRDPDLNRPPPSRKKDKMGSLLTAAAPLSFKAKRHRDSWGVEPQGKEARSAYTLRWRW